jgi:hypothetical protein
MLSQVIVGNVGFIFYSRKDSWIKSEIVGVILSYFLLKVEGMACWIIF